MLPLKPYIALDLETTGLNLDKSQIIQIAAIYDDGVSPLTDLPRFNLFINDTITYAETGALALHEKSQLFTKLEAANKAKISVDLHTALDSFLAFVEAHRKQGNGFKYRISLAGKNAGTYDLPLLRRWMTLKQRRVLSEITLSSVIDVGSIYFPDFGRVPSLKEILQLVATDGSKTEVCHDALEDSVDVVVAIRHKMQI